MAQQDIGELVYKISADVEGFGARLKEAENAVTQLTQKIQQNTDNQIKAVFKGQAAWDLLKKGISTATSFLESSIKKSVEADAKMARFRNTMASMGDTVAAQIPAVESYSRAMAKLGVDDEDAATSVAKLARLLNGNVKQAMDLTTLASNLASSGFYDFQTNVDNLLNILSGHGNRVMRQYNLTLDATASKQQILDGLTKKVTTTTEQFSKTTAGQLAIVQEAYTDLQEAVGDGLVTAFYGFTQEAVTDVTKVQDNLGQVSTDTAKFGVMAGAAFGLVIDGIKSIIQGMYGFAKVNVQAFRGLLDLLKGVADGIMGVNVVAMDTVTGQFGKAKQDFEKYKGFTKDSFSSASKYVSEAGDTMKQTFDQIGKDADSAGKHYSDMLNADEKVRQIQIVKKAAENAAAARKQQAIDLAQADADASAASGKLTDAVKKLQDAYIELRDKGTTALIELSDAQDKELKDLRDKIQATKADIQSLLDDFNNQKADDNRSIAEQIVAWRQKIIDDQKELAKESDPEQRTALQKEITDTQTTLLKNQGLIQSLDAEIKAATARAAESELQRTIDDYQQKRLLAQKEFADKKAALEQELALEQQNELGILAIYAERQAGIERMMTDANTAYQLTMDQHKKITEDTVNSEIATLTKLAEAISAAKSASANELNNLNQQTAPAPAAKGKAMGGYTVGGEFVHAGEWVMPAWMVNTFSGLVNRLEAVRTGQNMTSRTVNAPISINANVDGQVDFRAIGRDMAWELSRLK